MEPQKRTYNFKLRVSNEPQKILYRLMLCVLMVVGMYHSPDHWHTVVVILLTNIAWE